MNFTSILKDIPLLSSLKFYKFISRNGSYMLRNSKCCVIFESYFFPDSINFQNVITNRINIDVTIDFIDETTNTVYKTKSEELVYWYPLNESFEEQKATLKNNISNLFNNLFA